VPPQKGPAMHCSEVVGNPKLGPADVGPFRGTKSAAEARGNDRAFIHPFASESGSFPWPYACKDFISVRMALWCEEGLLQEKTGLRQGEQKPTEREQHQPAPSNLNGISLPASFVSLPISSAIHGASTTKTFSGLVTFHNGPSTSFTVHPHRAPKI
jgi:hypothetical protein